MLVSTDIPVRFPLTESVFTVWLHHAFRAASDPDGVVLATVHKVKGQEWPRVLIYGVNEGLMPHRLAVGEIEEERRIMHVALTRGREEVLILFSNNQGSRFLRELQEAATPCLETNLATVAPAPRRTGETRIVDREAPPHAVRPRPALTLVPHLGDTLVLSGGYSGIVIYMGEAGASPPGRSSRPAGVSGRNVRATTASSPRSKPLLPRLRFGVQRARYLHAPVPCSPRQAITWPKLYGTTGEWIVPNVAHGVARHVWADLHALVSVASAWHHTSHECAWPVPSRLAPTDPLKDRRGCAATTGSGECRLCRTRSGPRAVPR